MKLPSALQDRLQPFFLRYPYPVFDLSLESPESKTLQGFVLTRKQAQELSILLPELFLQLHILEESEGIGFKVGKSEVLSLYASPALTELSTQWEASEPPLKCLWARESLILVQKYDGTLAWALQKELQDSSPPPPPPPLRSFDLSLWIEELQGSLNTPYLLGGRSKNQIDCSGLIQRSLWNCFSWVYPRHSTQQLKQGKRVPPGQEQIGNLLFARHIQKNRISQILHVGVLLPQHFILHACRSFQKVQISSHEEFFKSYAYSGVRTVEPEKRWFTPLLSPPLQGEKVAC